MLENIGLPEKQDGCKQPWRFQRTCKQTGVIRKYCNCFQTDPCRNWLATYACLAYSQMTNSNQSVESTYLFWSFPKTPPKHPIDNRDVLTQAVSIQPFKPMIANDIIVFRLCVTNNTFIKRFSNQLPYFNNSTRKQDALNIHMIIVRIVRISVFKVYTTIKTLPSFLCFHAVMSEKTTY